MRNPIENKLKTMIEHSGNSDVDLVVNVDIDTKPIAYSILCSLYAKGEISEHELEKAIKKLDSLIERNKKSTNDKHSHKESRAKLFDFPQQGKTSRWI
ncbi:hypothetical protein [Bacillus sp. B15-48]|uniref:hypothetical protein n=1 Tax=Bacillus sp. B15-48 TaxID=1548601 RepID=UPI00193F2CA0|nr:hypothetical protein [Bacillus sp. B15-48]MBM4762807.1 hypothetical protein [Bacillus sp. B15-48]